jgi:hypothetical protein
MKIIYFLIHLIIKTTKNKITIFDNPIIPPTKTNKRISDLVSSERSLYLASVAQIDGKRQRKPITEKNSEATLPEEPKKN